MQSTEIIDNSLIWQKWKDFSVDDFTKNKMTEIRETGSKLTIMAYFGYMEPFMKNIKNTFPEAESEKIDKGVNSILGENFFSNIPENVFILNTTNKNLKVARYCVYAQILHDFLKDPVFNSTLNLSHLNDDIKNQVTRISKGRDLFKNFDDAYSNWKFDDIISEKDGFFSKSVMSLFHTKIIDTKLTPSSDSAQILHEVLRKIVFCVQYWERLISDMQKCAKSIIDMYPTSHDLLTPKTQICGNHDDGSLPCDDDDTSGAAGGQPGDTSGDDDGDASGDDDGDDDDASGTAGGQPGDASGTAGGQPGDASGAAGGQPGDASGTAGGQPAADELASTKAECQRLKKELETVKTLFKTQTSVLEASTDAKKTVEEERDQLKIHLDDSKGLVGNLKKSLKQANARIEAMNKNHELGLKQLNDQIQSLEDEKRKLEESFQEKIPDIQMIEGIITNKEKEISNLTKENEDLKDQISKMNKFVLLYQKIANENWPKIDKKMSDYESLPVASDHVVKWADRLQEFTSLCVKLNKKNDLGSSTPMQEKAILVEKGAQYASELQKAYKETTAHNTDLQKITTEMTQQITSLTNQVVLLSGQVQLLQGKLSAVETTPTSGSAVAASPCSLTKEDIKEVVTGLFEKYKPVPPAQPVTIEEIGAVVESHVKQNIKTAAVSSNVLTADVVGKILDEKFKAHVKPAELTKDVLEQTLADYMTKPAAIITSDRPQIPPSDKGDGGVPGDEPGELDQVVQEKVQEEIGKRIERVLSREAVKDLPEIRNSNIEFANELLDNISSELLLHSDTEKTQNPVKFLVEFINKKEEGLDFYRDRMEELHEEIDALKASSGARRY